MFQGLFYSRGKGSSCICSGYNAVPDLEESLEDGLHQRMLGFK